MEAVGVNIIGPGEEGVTINAASDDLEASGVCEPDGVLDDTLLNAVTPRLALIDEPVTDVLRPTFCTRCRSISASFLSSSYLTGGSDTISISNHERCPGRDSQSRFSLGETPDSATRADVTDDDVPLLRDEDGGMESVQNGPSTGIGSEHCHIPRASSKSSKRAMTKLATACCLTSIFMVAEIVGGYLANSIAIMSDAAHLFSDLTSFIVSLVAIFLAMRPASKRMNFGYHRAEVLGAVISILIIWILTGILVYAAIMRIVTMDFEVDADIMIIVAAIGVVINIILGAVLHAGPGGHGHSHHSGRSHSNSSAVATDSLQQQQQNVTNVNVRAAFIHVLGDLVQSVGVLVAAYIIHFYPEYKIADPICTFLFSILVIFTTVPILKDLGNVLMEGTPIGIEYTAVCANLTALPGVKMVHSLHVWALTLDKTACSVHLAIGSNTDPEMVLRDAQRLIRTRHQIFQTTIQVERYQPQLMDSCQQCQPLT